METNNQKSKNTVWSYLLFLALVTGSAALGFTTLTIALFAAAACIWNPFAEIPIAVSCVGVYWFLGRNIPFTCMMAAFAVIGIVIGILNRKLVPNRITLLVTCVLMLITLFGTDLLEASLDKDMNLFQVLSKGFDDEVFSQIAAFGINPEALVFGVEAFTAMIYAAVVFILSRIVTILVTLIPAFKPKKMRTPLIPIISPFRMWLLSDNFGIGLIVAACAVIAVNAFSLVNADIYTAVIAAVFLTPVLGEGIAYSAYIHAFLRANKRSIALRIALILTAVISFPFGVLIMGLIDLYGHVRIKSYKRAEELYRQLHPDEDNDKDDDKDDDDNNNRFSD